MKAEVSNQKLNRKALCVLVLSLLLLMGDAFYVGFTFAPGPTASNYQEGGVNPGAPSYTIWRESSTYYAKDQYGTMLTGYDAGTSNISALFTASISATSGLGSIFAKAGTYTMDSVVTLKPNITIYGEGSGNAGTIFEAKSGFASSSMFQIDASSDTLCRAINFQHVRIDGNGESVTALNLTNIGSAYLEDVAIVDCDTSILIDFYGTVPPSSTTIPGGVTLSSCRFRPNTNETCLDYNYATQCWINNCWFVSGSNVTINLFDCNKIHGQNNELNDCYYGVVITDDDNPSSHTINFDNNHIDVRSTGYAVYSSITTPDPYDAIRFTDTYIVGNDIDTIVVDSASQVVFEGSSIANRVFHDFNIASVSNGADNIEISHYVVGTPTSIVVTPWWNAGGCYITSRNATHFVVDWANNPGSGTYLCWEANYQP